MSKSGTRVDAARVLPRRRMPPSTAVKIEAREAEHSQECPLLEVL
jgi:hypothetical protein